MTKKIGVLFLLVSLCGCVLYGRDFSASQVKNIETNVTTQKQIFGMFGEPVRKGLDSGYEAWTYSYHSYSLGGGLRTKELSVVFNRDGTVRTYSFTAN